MIAALLLAAAQLSQQTPQAPQTPLKCDQYQHVQHTDAHCANTCVAGSLACTTECRYVPEETRCVNDMHTVSEREWQELMQRLGAIERHLKPKG